MKRNRANEDVLAREYQLRFSKLQAYRDQVWKVLVRHFFQPMPGAKGRVLDLGCGWGEFINNLSAAKRFAMDLNPDARAHLDPAVQFIHQDCSETWPLDDASLDLVFTSNFLEHLPDKDHISKTLLEARRCLKPGGHLICLGPNIRYVPGAYWDFWDHYVPMTDRSLAEALRLSGFLVQQQVARFLPYSMSDKPPPPLVFVKLYLKLKPAWRIFGKQFLVIASRHPVASHQT